MSKSVFLALLSIFISIVVLGQDTAWQRIATAKDDTLKVVALANYANNLSDTDKAKSLDLYKQLIDLSKKLKYSYWTGMAWFKIGNINANSANDKQAIDHYRPAIPYFKEANKPYYIAACLLNLGSCSERIGDINGRMRAAMEAIQMLQNTEHQSLLSHSYNSLAVMFFNLDDFRKSIAYNHNALVIARKIKDTTEMVQSLSILSVCMSKLKKFDSAFSYATEAQGLAEGLGAPFQLASAHTSFSELYIEMKNATKAIRHSQDIIRYAVVNDDVHHQLLGLINLAEGYNLTGNQSKRVHYLQQALKIGQEKGVTIQLDDIYKGLSEAYSHLGSHAKALHFYKDFIVYRDSVTNDKNKKNVTELELKYQTAQKEKIISEKQLQLTKQNMQLQKSRQYTLYSIGGAIIALLSVGLIYNSLRNKKKFYAKQLQSIQQEKEIQLLQALMQGEEKERSRIAKDLHDGVAGMLAAVKMHFTSMALHIGGVLQSEGYHQGVNLLDEATGEVRKTSHNLMPEVLLQHGLDKALQRYCGSISNIHSLVVQYDSWGEIGRYKHSFELSVYRIVQELLNNIVKHSKAKQAIVQLSSQNNVLSITVEDNGIGFSNDDINLDGMGLNSLKARVNAINGKIELDVEPGSGVSAYLEFETVGLKQEELV